MALKPATIAVTVTTAGTRTQVSTSSTPVSWIRFQAKHSNAGDVYIGDNTVAATKYVAYVNPTEEPSFELKTNDSAKTTGNQMLLSDFYLDAENNSAVCMVSYLPRLG